MNLIPVVFHTGWSLYNANDVAGFEPALAAELVDKRKVAAYYNIQIVEEHADEAIVETKRPNFTPNPEFTLSKLTRMDADALLNLATERHIDLKGATLKKHTLPIIKAVLFPEAVKEDENE